MGRAHRGRRILRNPPLLARVRSLQVIDPEAAHYKLTDPGSQIRAYVEDVIRGTIPTKTLDDTFSSKDQLALAVTSQLSAKMGEYGE